MKLFFGTGSESRGLSRDIQDLTKNVLGGNSFQIWSLGPSHF